MGYVMDSLDFFTDVQSADDDRTSGDRDDSQRKCVSQALFPKQESGVPTVQMQHKQMRESRMLARTNVCASLRESRAPLRESHTPLRESRAPLRESRAPLRESRAPLRESRALLRESMAAPLSASRPRKVVLRVPPKKLEPPKGVEV